MFRVHTTMMTQIDAFFKFNNNCTRTIKYVLIVKFLKKEFAFQKDNDCQKEYDSQKRQVNSFWIPIGVK